jgi:hypothetical protein
MRAAFLLAFAATEGAVSLELDNDGPFSQRRAQDRADGRGNTTRRHDEAPAWPVLARLPRVEGPGAAPLRAPLPTFAPEPIVGEAPLEYVEQAPLRYTDRPHAADRHELHVAPQAEYTAEPTPTVAFKPPSQQSSARRYRIDAGDAAHTPRQHRVPADEQPSLSDAIFRANAALAPHMGLVSAAALLLAASFVYWFAIGRQGTVAAPMERLQFGAGLTHDDPGLPVSPLEPTGAPALEPAATAVTPEASASAVTAPRIDQPKIDAPKIDEPEIDWTTPPRVAEAPAAIEPSTPTSTPTTSAPASPPQRTGEPTEAPQPTGPALTPPAVETPATQATAPSDSASAAVAAPQATQQVTQTPAELDNGITPTPELDVYPTTSFPAFSFVDQTPAGQTPAMATAPNGSAQR